MALLSHSKSLQASTMLRCAPFRSQRTVTCKSGDSYNAERAAGAALLASALLAVAPPSLAELNTFEAEAGGEFGRGSALQYGEADLQGRDFHQQVWPQWADKLLTTRYCPRVDTRSWVYNLSMCQCMFRELMLYTFITVPGQKGPHMLTTCCHMGAHALQQADAAAVCVLHVSYYTTVTFVISIHNSRVYS